MMKKTLCFLLQGMLLMAGALHGQSFTFSMPNSHFVTIPGGGFETRAWVEVPTGDSVILMARSGPEIYARFQPSVVRHNQYVYLVAISVDTSLSPSQTIEVVAQHQQDSVTKTLYITNNNDGSGA